MLMPSSWLHRSCDSLARSVFLCARFCQPFSPPPPLPLDFVGFSPLMFSVWRMPVPFLSCGGSWLGCDVVPVMGTLFQSRGWLPIVPEAPGYSRHPTSILAMQLLTMVNCLIICALMKKTLTMTKPYGLIKPFRGKLQSYKLQATSYKIHTVCVLDTLKGLSPVCTSIWSFNLDALEHTTLQSGCGHTWRLPSLHCSSSSCRYKLPQQYFISDCMCNTAPYCM